MLQTSEVTIRNVGPYVVARYLDMQVRHIISVQLSNCQLSIVNCQFSFYSLAMVLSLPDNYLIRFLDS